jgi:hypothetical protein
MPIRTITLKVFSMSDNQTIVAVSEEGEGRFYLERKEVSDVLDLSVELFPKLKANAPIQLLIQGAKDILDLNMTLEILFAGGVQEMNLQYVVRGDKDYYIDNIQKYAGKKKKLCNLYSEESLKMLLVNMTDVEKDLQSLDILRRFPDFILHISEGTKNDNQFLGQLLDCDDDNTFLSLVTILTKELMSVHHPENMRACLDPVKRKLLLYQKLPEDIKNHEIFCLEMAIGATEIFNQLPENFKKKIRFCSAVAMENQEVFGQLSLEMSILIFELIPEDIKNNKEFCLIAVLKKPELFESLPENIKNNKEFCLAAVLEKPELFKSLPEDIKNDTFVCVRAANLNDATTKHMSDIMRNIPGIKEILQRSATPSDNPGSVTIHPAGIIFGGNDR